MKRLLKAVFFAVCMISVIIAMRLVSVFPEPWNIIAHIAVLIFVMYMLIDEDSEKKEE